MGIYHGCSRELESKGHLVTNPKGAKVINPVFYLGNKSLATALKIAAEFGFTPTARWRIPETKPKLPKSNLEMLIDGYSEDSS